MPTYLFYLSFLNGGGFTQNHVTTETVGKNSCLESPVSGEEPPQGLPWGCLPWAAWWWGRKEDSNLPLFYLGFEPK